MFYHQEIPRRVSCLQLFLYFKYWLFAPLRNDALRVTFHTMWRWLIAQYLACSTGHNPLSDYGTDTWINYPRMTVIKPMKQSRFHLNFTLSYSSAKEKITSVKDCGSQYWNPPTAYLSVYKLDLLFSPIRFDNNLESKSYKSIPC